MSNTEKNTKVVAEGDANFRNDWEKIKYNKSTEIIRLLNDFNSHEAKEIINSALSNIDKVSKICL